MPRQNAVRRVIYLGVGDEVGTGFLLDVADRQYLITAKHLAGKIASSSIDIWRSGGWHQIAITAVHHCSGTIDISVVALSERFVRPRLLATERGVQLGQDLYFLGFPHNMFTEHPQVNEDFPLPFVKRATFSALKTENGETVFYLDGFDNPGFSGGPVLFRSGAVGEFQVAAVVSRFVIAKQPLLLPSGAESKYSFIENTGIIRCWSIRHAIELIQRNPFGTTLT
jgi:S1-C subfamily serine protease